MSDSNATYTVTINVSLPDNAAEIVRFYLFTEKARNTLDEVFPYRQEYKLTLDADGAGTIALPTPDNTGASSWTWRVFIPRQNVHVVTLAYSAGAQELADLLEAGSYL